MISLESDISDLVAALRTRRKDDRELDEMCRDLEILSADLAEAPRGQDPESRCLEADIRESLAGLEQEIRAKVSALGDGIDGHHVAESLEAPPPSNNGENHVDS